MLYRVIWVIDVDADCRLEAAKKALAIQQDKESTATVFTVLDENGFGGDVDASPE